jgi:hypothetical protein
LPSRASHFPPFWNLFRGTCSRGFSGEESFPRKASTNTGQHTQRGKARHASIPRVKFESTISVFRHYKTEEALDRSPTLVGTRIK